MTDLPVHSSTIAFDYFVVAEGPLFPQSSPFSYMACFRFSHLLSLTSQTLRLLSGESSRLIRHLGFGRNVTRYGPGIGVVVNLDIDTSDSSQQKVISRSFLAILSISHPPFSLSTSFPLPQSSWNSSSSQRPKRETKKPSRLSKRSV